VPVLNLVKLTAHLAFLFTQSQVKDPETGEENLVCPCCRRAMNIDETKIFIETMKSLASDKDIIDTDDNAQEKYKSLKTAYQSMRKALEGGIDDIRDSRRMTDESCDLEKDVQKLQDELNHCHSTFKEQTIVRDDLQKEVIDLRELVDTIRRWMDDAGRIVEKKLQICQKKLDLRTTSTDSSRDLKTVDRHITELREEKEALSSKILRLNKEMSELNQKISEVSSAVSSFNHHKC
jgi:chromosome segregation ATPase